LWNSPLLARLGWLNRSSPDQRSASYGLMQSVFPGFIKRYRDRLTPTARMVGDEFARDAGNYSSRIAPHSTVVHGDFPARPRQRQGDFAPQAFARASDEHGA